MGLADNKCVPCRGGVPPLPNDRVQALLNELGRGWALNVQGHLERLIADGLLAPGVKLPATRELAQSLRVNRATVALAYEELVAAARATDPSCPHRRALSPA